MRVSKFSHTIGLLTLLLFWSGCSPSGSKALLQGDRLLREGKVKAAVTKLEIAVAKMPEEPRAWNRLGMAYHASGNLGEAEKAYLRSLRLDPNLFETHFNLGELRVATGAYRDAEAAYRTFLNAKPENASHAPAWRGLAVAQLRQNKLAEAESSLGQALRTEPKDAQAWNVLGMTRIQQRRFQDAYDTFIYAAHQDPSLSDAHRNAAVTAQQHLGNPQAAIASYRAYLATNPPDAAAVREILETLTAPSSAAGRTPSRSVAATPTPQTQARPRAIALDPTEPAAASTNQVEALSDSSASAVALVRTNQTPEELQPDILASPARSVIEELVARLSPPLDLAFDPVRSTPAEETRIQPEPEPEPEPSARVTATSPAPVRSEPEPEPEPEPELAALPDPVPVPDPAPLFEEPAPESVPDTRTVAAASTAPDWIPDFAEEQAVEEPAREPVREPEVVRVPDAMPLMAARDVLPPPDIQPPPPGRVVEPAPVVAPSRPTALPLPTTTTVVRQPDPLPAEPAAAPAAAPAPAVPGTRVVASNPNYPSMSAAGTAPQPEPVAILSAPPARVSETNPGWVDSSEADRQTMWQRVNPVNWGNPSRWIRRDRDEEREAVPLQMGTVDWDRSTVSSARTPVELGRAPNLVTEVRQPTSSSRPPAPPRYTPRWTGELRAGDRTAAEAEFRRGLSAQEQRDAGTALSAYRRATELDPTHFEAQHNLVVVALAQQDLNLALEASERALTLVPDSVSARFNYAVALQRSRYSREAAEQLEQVARMQSGNASVHLALANLYRVELSDMNNARRHYERVLAIQPQHPRAAEARRWLIRPN